MLANATCVDYDNIGVVFDRRGGHAVEFKHSGDAFRIVVIHLTPKGAHDVFAIHSLMSLPPQTLAALSVGA